jgi:hypothetical protein
MNVAHCVPHIFLADAFIPNPKSLKIPSEIKDKCFPAG